MTQGSTTPAGEGRVGLVSVIKGPIGLMALVALISEGVLGVAVMQLEGAQKFYIALGMIVVLLALLGIVALSVQRGGRLDASAEGAARRPEEERFEYEVFVAAVMAGHATPSAYEDSRAGVMRVVQALRAKCKHGVFYAGETLATTDAFEQAGMVATEDMRKVARSRYFLMIYPEKAASSVLMEAGVALANERPSVYCVKDIADLPYLMQRAVLDKNVKATAITVTTIDQLIKIIEQSGLEIFQT